MYDHLAYHAQDGDIAVELHTFLAAHDLKALAAVSLEKLEKRLGRVMRERLQRDVLVEERAQHSIIELRATLQPEVV